MTPEIKNSVIMFLDIKPKSTTREVSEMLGLSMPETFDILRELKEKGLVSSGTKTNGTLALTWELIG